MVPGRSGQRLAGGRPRETAPVLRAGGPDASATRSSPFQRRGAYVLLLGVTLLTFLYTHLLPTGAGDGLTGGLLRVNVLFLARAAGGTVLAGTLIGAGGVARLRPLARIAERIAIASLALTGVFVGSELGRPDALWTRLRPADLTSSLPWELVAISTYLAYGVGLGYLAPWVDSLRAATTLPRGQRLAHLLAVGRAAVAAARAPSHRRLLRELVAVLAPTAVLLDSIPAWAARHLRTGPDSGPPPVALLTIASTLVVSLVLGLALVIAIAALSRIFLTRTAPREAIRDLGSVLLVLIGFYGACLLAEMETTRYTSAGDHFLSEMMAGPSAPLFWFVWFGGVLVPFLLLWFSQAGGVGVAALLVIVGALIQRWQLVIPPLLGHAHLPYTEGGYSPSAPELSLTLAACAAGALGCLPPRGRRHPQKTGEPGRDSR